MVKFRKATILLLCCAVSIVAYSQSLSSHLTKLDEILSLADGSFKTPGKTFSLYIKSLAEADLKTYISCMSSKRKKELVQTDSSAKNFDNEKVDKAVACFKNAGYRNFNVENVFFQENPPKVIFISSALRGPLFIKEETTISFSFEEGNWLISDLNTRSLEKAVK